MHLDSLNGAQDQVIAALVHGAPADSRQQHAGAAFLNGEPMPFDRIWKGVAWKDMTTEQKFEFLIQWCENLTRQVERHGSHMDDVHSRLRAIEDKLGAVR